MRVLDYLMGDPTLIVEAINNLINPESPLTEKVYLGHYVKIFSERTFIPSNLTIGVDCYEYQHDDPIDDWEEIFLTASHDDFETSIGFIAWSELMPAPVTNNTKLNNAEVAAHLFNEITFFGDENDMEKVKGRLIEQMSDSVGKTYSAEEVFERHTSHYTDEKKAELMERIAKRSLNLKTVRIYRNGERLYK